MHAPYKQTINFSVGKWSALIKQAKKKDAQQVVAASSAASLAPPTSAQAGSGDTAAVSKRGDGKYQF